jgi:hypothetical protein
MTAALIRHSRHWPFGKAHNLKQQPLQNVTVIYQQPHQALSTLAVRQGALAQLEAAAAAKCYCNLPAATGSTRVMRRASGRVFNFKFTVYLYRESAHVC